MYQLLPECDQLLSECECAQLLPECAQLAGHDDPVVDLEAHGLQDRTPGDALGPCSAQETENCLVLQEKK